MEKLLSFFSISWVKYALIGSVIGLYTYTIFSIGKTIEHTKTLELQNKYTNQELENTKLAFDTLNYNIGILGVASKNFQDYQGKVNVITKEIHTQSVKELERPVYKECTVSKEYFDLINNKIDELNGK